MLNSHVCMHGCMQVMDGSQAAEDSEPTTCTVCCEQLQPGELVKSLPCAHKYHGDCIDQWLQVKAVCPICQCSIRRK